MCLGRPPAGFLPQDAERVPSGHRAPAHPTSDFEGFAMGTVSARRIAANRKNAKNSTGPRTRRGKSRTSRNSVRHGLESVRFGVARLSKNVERLAKAICPDSSDPFRYEQAVIIAESQIMIARVRKARVSALESPRAPVHYSAAERSDRRGDWDRDRELLDHVAMVRHAIPELLSLERYERRALS